MPTVVVTGASGFVGRQLTTFLRTVGVTVLPLSRRALPGTEKVDDYRHTPTGDVVVHLAGPSRATANQIGRTVIGDSANVSASLARRFNGRIVYASSALVYGSDCAVPCRTDTPVRGTDVYSMYKLHNEEIVLDAGGAVARLSNLVGSGLAANTVIAEILSQVPGEGPVRIRDTTPICDFLAVSDAASALGLMALDVTNEVINVGSGIGTSIGMVAQLALMIAKEEHRTIVATDPSSRQSINVLDITDTRSRLAWAPTSSLKNEMDCLISEKARIW